MMAFKNIYSLALLCLCFTNLSVSDSKFSHLTICDYRSNRLVFTCGEWSNKNLFPSGATFECHTEMDAQVVFNISFVDCNFRKLPEESLSRFGNVKTLDIQDLNLSVLPRGLLYVSSKLEEVFASNNQFHEIPANSFSNSLITANLSNNQIQNIDSHAFDGLSQLLILDLSSNPITNLKVETFVSVPNVKVLNLKNTNLTTIVLGTFAFQEKLVSLNLSWNKFKEFDFALFAPILRYLDSLDLYGNQINVIHHFRNALVPKLTSLDIRNNPFNCTYLLQFLGTVDWKNVSIPTSPSGTDIKKVNIRGVNCEL